MQMVSIIAISVVFSKNYCRTLNIMFSLKTQETDAKGGFWLSFLVKGKGVEVSHVLFADDIPFLWEAS